MPDSKNILLPDIGDFDAVEIIEILVAIGDKIQAEDSILTLESDKASMEIPTPFSGVVKHINVNIGDKIKQGDLLISLDLEQSAVSEKSPNSSPTAAKSAQSTADENVKPAVAAVAKTTTNISAEDSHASPSIRKLARELGVDLSKISGNGQKGRILDSDLKSYVKQIITSGGGIPSIPVIDFSQFGEIETQPLSRINKISGKHLTACWLNIPHVTQFDEVNIEKIEAFRQEKKSKGIKLTPLVFIIKAVIQALKQHPRLNSSLDPTAENLIIKKYFNLGIAMDTPAGLIVPVIRDSEKKSLKELADELAETSAKARAGKLKSADLQGASFTISSLGGIGGTQFTPIINAPEVAILGVSRTYAKPVYNGEIFQATATLPLALSYDHRVIDGAQGGRFMATLNHILQNFSENEHD